MTMLRRGYGASPLHLAAHAAALALAGWALLQVLDINGASRILLWLGAAVLVHDALLWPLYSALDQAGRTAAPLIDRGARVSAVNHVRVPAVLSGVLALAYFPAIAGRSAEGFRRASGEALEGSLERWLLATAVLFAGSAIAYAIRVRVRASGGGRPPAPR